MTGLSTKHAEWLESRGLDIELAARLGLHSAGPWLRMSYLSDDGTELFAKCRTTDKKFKTEPNGAEMTRLFNEACLSERPDMTDVLIICEGELDALACLQAGFRFVVSVPGGAPSRLPADLPMPRYMLAPDGSLKPGIVQFGGVVLMTDADEPGANLRTILENAIGSRWCRLPTYPEGCKDANDVLRLHSVQALRDMIASAVPAYDDGHRPVSVMLERYKNMPRPRSFGVEALEPHAKFDLPEFMIIGGPTNTGKSTLAQAVIYSTLMANPGMRASMFCGEGSINSVIANARIFWEGIHGQGRDRERNEWVERHVAFMEPPKGLPTFEWLIDAIEHQARQRGINVFLIDPWNEIHLKRESGMSTTEIIGAAIIRLKAVARKHGLLLIVAHHVTKVADDTRPPSHYDLADSSQWANKADHVLMLWKKSVESTTVRLAVTKSKEFDRLGHPGAFWCTLDTRLFQLVRAGEPEDVKAVMRGSEPLGFRKVKPRLMDSPPAIMPGGEFEH